jgi:hypothetical protein
MISFLFIELFEAVLIRFLKAKGEYNFQHPIP